MRTADAWRRSDESLLLLCGPRGSGKTHILAILCADLVETGAAVSFIDDARESAEPADLLVRIEQAKATGERLIIAGPGEPSDWARGLKDLATRLNAAPRITLGEPDEDLLRAVMTKMFADRQLRAPEAIAAYAAPRIAKTFAAAEQFVAALDALSIERGQPIGLKLAREAVANLSEDDFGA